MFKDQEAVATQMYVANHERFIGDAGIELGDVENLSRFAAIYAATPSDGVPDFALIDRVQASGDALARDLFRISELPEVPNA